MNKLLAVGEILIDLTPSGTNELGMTLFARNPGGAPANVLAMNAKLGGSSAFVGKVGDDGFGRFLRQTLEDGGIDAAGLYVDPAVPTTLAFVQLDAAGERSFSFYRDPGADVMLCPAEVRRTWIEGCSVFHFGSVSMTADPSRSATLAGASAARELGKLVSFDPNYRPLLWKDEALAIQYMTQGVTLADVLKVSDEEMTLITGETDVAAGARKLLAMGPALVLVSMGHKGAWFATETTSGLRQAFRVKTVDTTGAGDAFLGAILYRLSGMDRSQVAGLTARELTDIVDFGNAAGALTTTRSGAIPALPTAQEIQTCLRTCGRIQW